MNGKRIIPTGCTCLMLMLLALTLPSPFGNDCMNSAGTAIAAEPFVHTNNIASALMEHDWNNSSHDGSSSAPVSGTNVTMVQPNSTVKYFYEKPRNTNQFGFQVEENNFDIGNWTSVRRGHFDNSAFAKLPDGEIETADPVTSTAGEIEKSVNNDRKISFQTLEQFDTCVQDKGGVKTIGAVANGASVEPVQTGIAGATSQPTKALSGANFDTVMASISR